MTRVPAVALAVALSSTAPLPAAVEVQLALDEVLFRANEAVVRSQRDLDVVLADERYEQRVLDADDQVRRERVLRSGYALVWLPERDVWGGFRDVLDVDGDAIRPRSRLEALVLDDGAGVDEAQRVSSESERHDIGDAFRGLNVPTMPLLFLLPINQDRFHFEKVGEDRIEDVDTWVIRYSEYRRPTLIRTGATELFARGVFWIEPLTGSVVQSELHIGDANSAVRSRFVVTYRLRDGIWLPERMEETYDFPGQRRADRVTGVATYSNFRWPDPGRAADDRSR